MTREGMRAVTRAVPSRVVEDVSSAFRDVFGGGPPPAKDDNGARRELRGRLLGVLLLSVILDLVATFVLRYSGAIHHLRSSVKGAKRTFRPGIRTGTGFWHPTGCAQRRSRVCASASTNALVSPTCSANNGNIAVPARDDNPLPSATTSTVKSFERPITFKVRLLSGSSSASQPQLSLLRRTFKARRAPRAQEVLANPGQASARVTSPDG
jgi:hypothetical protein